MYCKRCGAPLHEGVVICPECGARQRQHTRTVRCASCHHRVPLGLTVCPYCARTVRPAGPRWALWLGFTAALALLALWGMGKIPVERVAQQIATVRQQATDLARVLGPADTGSPTVGNTPQVIAQVTLAPTPTATATRAPEVQEDTPTPAPSPTPELSPTPAPTETEMPTPTEASPTPTFTPAPPTATPTRAASGNTTYRVQSGDTLSSIAARFGIPWEDLAAANGLTARSVLRIGQELIIPVAGAPARPPATATATRRPAQPPTPTPLPPTPAPSLPAPVQIGPGDGSSGGGRDAIIMLEWEPVPGIPSNAQYEVIIRWLEQGASLEHRMFTTAVSARVPLWLWGKADQPARRYTWTVRVVQITTDGQGGERVIPLSPASPARIFYWG